MITVIGSFAVDLVTRTPRFPAPGETVLGGTFSMGPGGKGSNQAVAAAKQGARVNFITKVGKDSFADVGRKLWAEAGIDFSNVKVDETNPTGTALIMVDSVNSENMIVVASGSCQQLTDAEIDSAEEMIAKSNYVIIQNEINESANIRAVELAQKHGVKVIYNPAPYMKVSEKIISGCYMATPNETEASAWSGVNIVDDASALEACRVIHSQGVEKIIITMGKRGCLVYEGDENYYYVDAFIVQATDTTGAGDSFNGGMVYAMDKGMSLKDAVAYGNAVGAVSVTKMGAAANMPDNKEVEAFIASRK